MEKEANATREQTTRPARGALLLWKWARGSELLLLSGVPAFAFLLSTTGLDLRRLVLFAAGTLALGAHVMTLNTLFGQRSSDADREVMDFPLGPEEWRPRQLAVLTALLLALAVTSLALLSAATAAAGFAIAFLWLLYAHPRICLKGRAPLDSVVHLAGGFAHFTLGTLAADAGLPLGRPLAWATGLAGIFVAGHLHHVIKDLDADRAAGIRTIGIALGPRRCFLLGTGLFLAAWLGLAAVAWREFRSALPAISLLASALATAVSASASFAGVSAGAREALLAHRRRYRLFFGLAGLVLLGSLLVRTFRPG